MTLQLWARLAGVAGLAAVLVFWGCAPTGGGGGGAAGQSQNTNANSEPSNSNAANSNTSNANTANANTSDPGAIPPGCTGPRTATSVPPPGSVQETTEFTFSLDPEDSDLARALGFVGFIDPSAFPPDVTNYEVGDNGDIVNSNQQFVVAFGCLTLETEEEEAPDPADEEIFNFFEDLPDVCPPGQIPLGPEGPFNIGDEFICVAADSTVCADCSQTSVPTWQAEVISTTTYRALGSITVEVTNPQTFQTETVDVQEGDEVTLTIQAESRFEIVSGS